MNKGFAIEDIESGRAVTVLRLQGQLDARAASELTARCTVVRGQGRHIVLNLAAVSFIASSGVGALLALVEECRQSHTCLRLAEVPPAVDSVIRLLNLDQFLSIDATEADSCSELEAA